MAKVSELLEAKQLQDDSESDSGVDRRTMRVGIGIGIGIAIGFSSSQWKPNRSQWV